MSSTATIAIIGGGIGGISAAIALQRAGFRARVYEQAPVLGEVGAGLSVTPNAVKGLDWLGITWDGEPLWSCQLYYFVVGTDQRVTILHCCFKKTFVAGGGLICYLFNQSALLEQCL